MRLALMPTTSAPTGFWDTARICLPVVVYFKNANSTTEITTSTQKLMSRGRATFTGPKLM